MSDLSKKPKPGYGPFYMAGLYPQLAEICRSNGYALAVHGSLTNDFDLIAVPWIENAADPEHIVELIYTSFAMDRDRRPEPVAKLHGRVAYMIHLSFGECRLDLSFMPRTRGST